MSDLENSSTTPTTFSHPNNEKAPCKRKGADFMFLYFLVLYFKRRFSINSFEIFLYEKAPQSLSTTQLGGHFT